jgi:hypothetical protein
MSKQAAAIIWSLNALRLERPLEIQRLGALLVSLFVCHLESRLSENEQYL